MIKKLCFTAVFCMLSFFLVEGLCSVIFVVYTLRSGAAPHRTLSGASMRYDAQLGWVSVPNFSDENYYAPGIPLRTNSRGFRANREFTKEVPPGKVRIVCSGDSQGFGDGVGNDHTWCQQMESIDHRLEAVNMAETGYGVDQMYLWYKSNSAALDHDVHILAVVTDDFSRMELSTGGGYGKPLLKLRNGMLATENIPVPAQSRFLHFLALKPNPLRQFRSITVMADLADRMMASRRPVAPPRPSDELRQIVDKVLVDFQAIGKRSNGIFVVVYLPTRVADYDPGGPSVPWREFLRAESLNRGIPFIDLLDDFQKLPITTRDGMFIWPGSVQYFAEAPGHYNDQGHEYMARQIYSRLISIPEVAKKLALHSGT